MKKIKKTLLTLLVSSTAASCVLLSSCNKTASFDFSLIDGESSSGVSIEEGKEYVLPIPVKEGYSFEGWYSNPDFSGDPITTITASENLSFYAKWQKLYVVNVNVNGGTLSSDKLYLGAGKNVSDFMKDFVPTKAGVTFAGWYLNDALVASDYVMPDADITLNAKYMAGYKAEYWCEKEDGSGYDLVSTDEGSELVGTGVSAEKDFAGFTAVELEDSVESLTVGDNASENVLKYYYDRKEVKVRFNTNYPTDAENQEESVTIKFGVNVELPSVKYNDIPGYVLIGWSTTPDGKVEYSTNYLDSLVYNKETSAATSDAFKPAENMTLYGVWAKGYVNMFQGDDYIFLLDENSKDIYMSRGGVYFKGEYNSADSTFVFYDSKDDVLFEGKLNSDGSYSYLDYSREKAYYLLDLNNNKVDKNTEIHLDSTNGISYVVKDSETGKNTTSAGTYLIDENGYYVATFTKGDLAGKTIKFVISSLDEGAFQIQNEEEAALGSLPTYYVSGSQLALNQDATLTINGFGYATYTSGTSATNYYYIFDHEDQIIYVFNTSTLKRTGIFKYIEKNGVAGVMAYNSVTDITCKNDDNSTLVMDGFYTATYKTADGTEVTGTYSTSTSAFGNTVVTFEAENVKHKFFINETEVESTAEDGSTTTTTVYSFEEKDALYAEYYYENADGKYYAPLFVINDSSTASVYAYTSSKTFVLISTGSYTYSSGKYTYSATEFHNADAEVIKSPYDLSTVKGFTCGVEAYSTSFFAYWYSVTTAEGTENFEKVYTYSDGTNTNPDVVLTTVAGKLTIKINGNTYTGTYQMKDDILVASTTGGTLNAILDEENHTFMFADSAPSTAYLLNKQSKDTTHYIKYDGKGNATYCVVGDDSVVTEYAGKTAKLDETTTSGGPIYKFTSNDGTVTFKFINLYTSTDSYYAMYDEEYNGKYDSEEGFGSLTLDGYNFQANYENDDCMSYTGYYYVADYENGVILVYIDGSAVVFDVDNTAKTYTVRGSEYGNTYFVMDNEALSDYIVTFDGYSTATVEGYKDNGSGESVKVTIDDNATYTIDGDTVTLVYTENSTKTTLVGKYSTFTYNNNEYHSFVVEHKEVETTYVNTKDWSVLILDSIGNATVYDATGVKDTGTYVIISESLLYYYNDAATSACIYKYDAEAGTATAISYKERGYYTSDLEALLFQKAGYAVFSDENGSVRYYYDIVDGDVYIYHKDETSAQANQYGYVKENFGEFDDVKEYNGKSYYSNAGYALQFTRVAETKGNYPVELSDGSYYAIEDLTFNPTGYVFSVTGSVKLNGSQYTATVVRGYDSNNELVMYVQIGSYRFYIDIDYKGVDEQGKTQSTYDVTKLENITNMYSYDYVYLLYQYYQMYGMDLSAYITNEFGYLQLVTNYGEDGKASSNEIRLDYGTNANGYTLYDSNGKLINFNGASYTVRTQSNGNYLFEASAKGSDGYTYTIYFTSLSVSALNKTAYYVYYMTRTEEVTTTDGYTVKAEKVVVNQYDYSYDSESSNGVGTLLSLGLSYNGEVITATNVFYDSNENLYFVSKEVDENGKVTSTKYYLVTLTDSEAVKNEDLGVSLAPTYASATVTPVNVTTYYNAEETSYVDISADNKLLYVVLNGTATAVSDVKYDSETATYSFTVKSTDDSGNVTSTSYTVKIVDGKAVFTEVAAPVDGE